MRRTLLSPRSGSTATSTNTAPKACIEKRWPASPGFESTEASTGWPRRRTASKRSLEPPPARASSRTLRQAACTALPTRLVTEPQLHGIHVQRHRQLVHGGFQRKHPACLPRSAHPSRRVRVHRRETLAREDVGARMQEAARIDERLGILLVGGGDGKAPAIEAGRRLLAKHAHKFSDDVRLEI